MWIFKRRGDTWIPSLRRAPHRARQGLRHTLLRPHSCAKMYDDRRGSTYYEDGRGHEDGREYPAARGYDDRHGYSAG
eukprot:4307198-Prymnesium_polylepis.1